MTKKLSILTILAAIAVCGGAFAAEDGDYSRYISARVGYAGMNGVDGNPGSSSLSIAYGIKGAESLADFIGAGDHISDQMQNISLRAEAEFSNQGFETNSGYYSSANNWFNKKINRSVNTFTINGYADFMKDEKIRPYVSASVGFGVISSDNSQDGKYNRSFGRGSLYLPTESPLTVSLAYGLGVGETMDISDRLRGDLGARVLILHIAGYSVKLFNITLGIRYDF
ncbi:MAG: outer membrane beta-barrel protein [Rickettsiales bacterium]|jgi:opacity protein-like surface antigen|nr:outer membrane beta-barrel protein [Rickettsiales bacterium]